MDAATDALASSNYALAEEKATAAMGVLAVLPIDARKEGHASGQFRYSETLINEFLGRVEKLLARQRRTNSNGFGMQTARYRHASGRCGDTENSEAYH